MSVENFVTSLRKGTTRTYFLSISGNFLMRYNILNNASFGILEKMEKRIFVQYVTFLEKIARKGLNSILLPLKRKR